MPSVGSSWAAAFKAFADKRALIMLFLGFSAGIPILLIFSSLSLWLGEAGIDKSAVTFFSWAALGYSFKFVWAPLIDELPLPFLSAKLGRRRAWLLVAQCLIILAICIMALSDPALGHAQLMQMAAGAVLLGFAAATQDIVIDAYRIELAEIELQTVLAATYNAGYRIGMIVAGAGALFLAAYLGTAKGNYIYDAWQTTYFVMAAVMLVGVLTTLLIHEPLTVRKQQFAASDYLRLVLVFISGVVSFILAYVTLGDLTQAIINAMSLTDKFLLFVIESLRFLSALMIAFGLGSLLVKLGAVNKAMAFQTWVAPVQDFFQRYGTKLALVLLLFIGFYRISDIIAGVISNVYYQDLNFSKAQIAEAVKVYGVIFSLVGGFLGGLLAQRYNVLKLLFVGAVLASSTNLIFIGLVKSGHPFAAVEVQVADQHYRVQPDEVGYWSLQVPAQVAKSAQSVQAQASFADQPQQQVQQSFPYMLEQKQPDLLWLPMSADNRFVADELKQAVSLQAQLSALQPEQLAAEQPISFVLDEVVLPGKLAENGVITGQIDGALLQSAKNKQITLKVQLKDGRQLSRVQRYAFAQSSPAISMQFEPITPLKADAQSLEIKAKVIKPYSSAWLYAAIVLDNLASGLAGAAFIAFLSSLTNISFTAVQYAIFSSLMTLTPKILGGYSGTIVSNIGYPNFFLMTTLIGIPILLLVWWVGRLLSAHHKPS